MTQATVALLLAVRIVAAEQTTNIQVLEDASQRIAAHDYASAERELKSLLQQEPTEHRAENLLGVIYAERGDDTVAEKEFRSAMVDPELAGARVNLGLVLERKREYPQAAELFEEAYRHDPTREDARTGAVRALRTDAQVAFRAGENEKALAELLRARKLAPNDPDLLYEFGIVCLRQSLYVDAESALTQAVTLRPSFAAAFYALGRAQIGTQHFGEAERSMMRYNELQPNDPTALYGLGLVASLQKRDVEARKYFERSLAIQPAQTESWFELGSLDLAAKDLPKAEEEFRHVLSRNPKHAGALLGLAQVSFQRREYPAVKSELQAALNVDPNLSKAHYYLGLTLARMGDQEGSARELQTADRLQHEDFERNRVQMRLADPPQP